VEGIIIGSTGLQLVHLGITLQVNREVELAAIRVKIYMTILRYPLMFLQEKNLLRKNTRKISAKVLRIIKM
jgi:hypothetical protein